MNENILKQLKGTSSVFHISVSTLESATGLSSDEVNTTLDALYEKRIINQATITRNGITEREVWLTGVIEKIPPSQYVMTTKKTQKTPEVVTEPMLTIDSAKIIQQKQEKTWALKLLELIEQHPGITSSEAAKRLNYKYISTALIPGYIHRGDVIAVRNHEHQMTFTLKAGMTAAEVYNKRVRKDTPKAAPIKDSIINFLDQAITEQLSDAPRQDEQKAHEDTSPLTTQIGGDHYKKLGIYQPWNVLQAWLTPEEFRGYMKGTCIAYLARERDKGGDMDIEKGTHTLQGLLKLKNNV